MDKQTFERRALQCARRLHRMAYTILGNEADCEDAVSEALLRAWTKLDSLREPQFFETWLTRILINVSKSMLKARTVRKEALLYESTHAQEESPSPNPTLRDAVQSLDIKLRLPLMMHHLEGYGVKEISEILRLPQTTVKWRLHRAREVLRAELAEGGEQA